MVKSRNRPKKTYVKRYTRKKRLSTTGKVLPPLDVRSSKHLKEFDRRLRKGPLTIILVYADWCGHCHTMMPHFDAASKSPNRTIQSIKVNEQMLDSVNNYINKNVNKTAKPLSVEGYPSIILVDNKGDKVSDIESVRDTNVMTKVMSQPVTNNDEKSKPINSNTNTNTNTNRNNSLNNSYGAINTKSTSLNNKNFNMGENELKGSMASLNAPRMKPDDMLIRSEDMTKPRNSNTNKNKELPFDIEESIAPSPLNTFSLPTNKNKEPSTNAPKNLEEKADSLINLRGPIEPPSPEEKIEGGGCGCGLRVGGSKKGGSLIGSISQAAYTLAAPAALLATASYVMSKKRTKKNSKRSRLHKIHKNKTKTNKRR
jgi:thiol-disulfide isomerase/thioredoxin